MARVHDSIEVDVATEFAYAYWTQFESYPEFMTGIQEVRHLGNGRLHWRGCINGEMREWDVEVVETIAGRRLVWTGPEHLNDTIIDMHPTDFGTTRITIEAEIEPLEATTDAVGYLDAAARRVHLDLERFRERLQRELPAMHAHQEQPPLTR